ncbi:Glyoxylase, beta-lactamase superfamily II [Pseudomonas taetrolens]|uniref:Glyoxylase, beta-lactamase superfamily II n=1 Tax=Pseudomonas taetrolens TaxID=47884 RepID=A0A0J6JNN1_PSETA|nr:MBL fold metallo-hydrolase [Pseudomonas taetrolens]KMM85417.1 Zn-dependent hydrolase [Pseudomonas taetrolens]SEC30660.1 Glyoxylase, beta-lactamase superfamily II [Pseudomonas taetrolens]SQF86322.1 Zn-dependent hydrolase [Pseudomonas taetrolens]VEH49399.1 Zn-dependent hydrolase [Pseudomonas taetrolens]
MSEFDARGHEWRDGLRYPWPLAPANGQVQEVAEGVLWLRMPLPFGLDHINLYLLRHGDGWVAVDTGLNSDQCRDVWEQVFVEVMAGLPLKAVICTHFHSDHTGVVGWLAERFRCPVLMTLGEFDALHHGPPRAASPDWAFLDFYQKAGFSVERATSLLPLIQGEHFRPQTAAGFTRLANGSELIIGGRHWQVVTGNGHSPEHACLYAADDGLLISGDQVLPRITSTIAVYVIEPEANPLRDWLDSIERLRVIPDSVLVLPAHERPFFNLHLRLDQLRDHHRAHLQQLLEACEEPRTALEMMAVLFKKLSGRFDELMAVGETLAHANYLMAEGALVREEQGGLHRYRRPRTGVSKFNPLEQF